MIFQTLQLLLVSTHTRHADASPATINATNNGRRMQGTGAWDTYAQALRTFFFYFFFYLFIYCTNAYYAYFDSTYGHYYHQQTCDDTWTTTTASLTRQNVATTSTCQNASMTTTRTCDDDKRVTQPPLAEHTTAINWARDPDTSRASTFFVCLFLIFQLTKLL